MKKARMNISHSRFILSKLKIFGEIVTTINKSVLVEISLNDVFEHFGALSYDHCFLSFSFKILSKNLT